MPSPKSGSPGSPVSPAEPKEAKEADVADPGEVDEIKAEQIEKKSGKYGAAPVKPHKPPQDEEDKKSWIEIELVDMNGEPVPGESYEIKLPDGQTVAEGTLDEKGWARVDGIDPGSCEVTFPNLDETVWEPK